MNEPARLLPSLPQPPIRRYAYRSLQDAPATHPLRRRTDPKPAYKPMRKLPSEPAASQTNIHPEQEPIGILVFRLRRKNS